MNFRFLPSFPIFSYKTQGLVSLNEVNCNWENGGTENEYEVSLEHTRKLGLTQHMSKKKKRQRKKKKKKSV